MAIELELSGGGPCLMSPDISAVPRQDPEVALGVPIAGNSAFHWARIHQDGASTVKNSTVLFYWADLSDVVYITAARLVGTSFVAFKPSRVADNLRLQPWILKFVNGGPRRHECVLEGIFLIPSDPLPTTSEFNVRTDHHVAKSTSAATLAEANGFSRLIFNAFNIELVNNILHQLQFFSNRRTC